jgi:hypothetical protein
VSGIELLVVLLPPAVIVALGLLLTWLGRGTIILRGRRRRAWRGK